MPEQCPALCWWHHWHTLPEYAKRHQVAQPRWYCRYPKLRWMLTFRQRCCYCLTEREYTVPDRGPYSYGA